MGHKVFEAPPIATEGSGRVAFTPQDVPLDVDATPPARIERRRARKNYQSEPRMSSWLHVKAYHHVVGLTPWATKWTLPSAMPTWMPAVCDELATLPGTQAPLWFVPGSAEGGPNEGLSVTGLEQPTFVTIQNMLLDTVAAK